MKFKIIILVVFLITCLNAKDQVTIYNENFSLVRSSIDITLSKGIQSYFMDNIPSTIEANSVIIKPLKGNIEIFSQNYEYDLANTSKILEKYIGKDIEIISKDDIKFLGKLQFNDSSTIGIIENNTNKLILIQRDEIRNISLAELPKNFFLKPTLHWRLNAPKAGKFPIDFSYMCTGMKWDVTYNTIWNEDIGKLEINSWVTIINRTGKAFLDTKLKLIAGDVQKIHQQIDRRAYAKFAVESTTGGAPDFEEKAFHDFHMYTLSENVNINNNQTKQLRLFPTKTVNAESRYEYITGSTDVQSKIKFINSKKDGLGIPLPKGVVKIYKKDDADNELEFIGEDYLDHTAKDEEVFITTGNAFDLVAKTITVERLKLSNKIIEREMKVTLKNRSRKTKTITVIHNLYGNWSIMKNSLSFIKKSATQIEFEKELKPDEVYELTWTERIES
ncbi:MAG: DUF4139 domain-containing protein [Candidatus Cloacimonetes bacterium]|nr:DUF4139 domain-containing protein [Candidatus Cloacimonadota bacterium]